MLVELRNKSQITIPKDIVGKLKLNYGDLLNIYEQDGMICAEPVVTYSKSYVSDLKNEVENLKKDISSGKVPTFDNVDKMIESLEN